MAKDLTIESDRLILRVLDESYAGKVLDFFIRNSDFLNKWEPIKESKFYTLEFQKQRLIYELKLMNEYRALRLWMFKKDDIEFNNIIGSVALNEIVRGCFHSCFLGYRMDEQNANNGYMTEAVNRLKEYAFNDLKLHRIEANIMPHNAASLRVVEKNGFINEGLSKKYLRINGQWEDHIHMVILNDDMESSD